MASRHFHSKAESIDPAYHRKQLVSVLFLLGLFLALALCGLGQPFPLSGPVSPLL